jgi:curved DNA-binding protein CbpA
MGKSGSNTYYDILGVEPDDTQEKIEEAYRELSLQYHPDSGNPDSSSEKIKEINKAYEILGDSESREVYDRLGHEEYTKIKRASGVDPSNHADKKQNERSDPESEKVYETGWILASQENTSGKKRWAVCTSGG